jgi:hypothetical protein
MPNMVTSHLPFVSVKAKPSIPKMTYMAGYYWFPVFEQNMLSQQSLLLIILGNKTFFLLLFFKSFFFAFPKLLKKYSLIVLAILF